MRLLFIALIAVVAATIISNGIGRDADVQLQIHEAGAQETRNVEQRAILARLESKNDSQVSEFVRDWRRAYPAASSEGLQELQIIEQKINNDIGAAAGFTLAAHQAKADRLNSMISAPFGGKVEARRPGI